MIKLAVLLAIIIVFYLVNKGRKMKSLPERKSFDSLMAHMESMFMFLRVTLYHLELLQKNTRTLWIRFLGC